MKLGTVDSIDNTNGLSILLDGEISSTIKKYKYLASYIPAVNDRVLIEECGKSYVVLGKINDSYAASGQVQHAASADSATHAASADSATHAISSDWSVRSSGATQYSSSGGGKKIKFGVNSAGLLWWTINDGTSINGVTAVQNIDPIPCPDK